MGRLELGLEGVGVATHGCLYIGSLVNTALILRNVRNRRLSISLCLTSGHLVGAQALSFIAQYHRLSIGIGDYNSTNFMYFFWRFMR